MKRGFSEASHLPEVFYKIVVFKNFAKFAGKHPCRNLFFNKIAGQLLCRTPPATPSRLTANNVKTSTRKDISSSRNNLFVAFLAAFGLGGLNQKVFLNVKL